MVAKMFGTADPAHPGVADLISSGDVFVGGPVTLSQQVQQII
jgi:ATP sulfurylase